MTEERQKENKTNQGYHRVFQFKFKEFMNFNIILVFRA